ncbi:MAG: sigma-54-dependent Fis family transcriptional regulator [Myxococcales bacterium]|nr:sigma-54-dependent Fis family transcriptional regulator [Myxococcales bacterium]MCB9627225.1 sigma-54-dependent Fis family transcriptional regulator [Sandaracinaceae bacterium]
MSNSSAEAASPKDAESLAPKARILIVEDDASMRELIEESLAQEGFQTLSAGNAEGALKLLESESVHAVVTDLNLGGVNGLELCRRIHALDALLPVVLITAFGSLDAAVGAVRAGAYDFITKPFKMEQLVLALRRAADLRAIQSELSTLRRRVADASAFETLVGDSAPMQRLRSTLDRVARSDAAVLILGESGTGKELIARSIHAHSDRRKGPFVAVNMGAIPSTLIESELFGHARGAFTSAHDKHAGLFVQANGGTLFLDEVGELPLELQPKLLRALEGRSVRPVGAEHDVSFDVRIVAATHRDLAGRVEEGTFREDLYFRLNVLDVHAPPLRARGRDVLTLAQHFLAMHAEQTKRPGLALSPEAAQRMLEYTWPGNVRELKNCVERAVALSRTDLIALADLPERIRDFDPGHLVVVSRDIDALLPLEVIERRYVLHVLEAVGGNRTVAADVLGMGRKTLYRKLIEWQVEPGATRPSSAPK